MQEEQKTSNANKDHETDMTQENYKTLFMQEALNINEEQETRMTQEEYKTALTQAAQQWNRKPLSPETLEAINSTSIPAVDKMITGLKSLPGYSDMTADERTNYRQKTQELARKIEAEKNVLSQFINSSLLNNKDFFKAIFFDGTILLYFDTMNTVIDFYHSHTYSHYRELFPDMPDYFKISASQNETLIDLSFLQNEIENLTSAEPRVISSIQAYKEKTGAGGISFSEFLDKILPVIVQGTTATLKAMPVIKSVGNRLLLLSNVKYQNALIEKTGRGKTGIFSINADGSTGPLPPDLNQPLLYMLLKSCYLSILSGAPNGLVSISYPDILKELGLDVRKRGKTSEEKSKAAREREINTLVSQINQIYGIIPGTTEKVQLLNVPRYNTDTEILTFQSPYMETLLKLNMRDEKRAIESGKRYHEWKCELMHATVANERNKSAVEMAQRILVGVQQRGTTKPDCKLKQYRNSKTTDKTLFTWHINAAALVNDCPQIKRQLDAQKSNSARTTVLSRAFKAMYRILKKKSDLYSYYNDATISEIIPTYSTLTQTEIKITHHGRNPKYKRPQLTMPQAEAGQINSVGEV